MTGLHLCIQWLQAHGAVVTMPKDGELTCRPLGQINACGNQPSMVCTSSECLQTSSEAENVGQPKSV